jgi:hypothetical protein
MPSEKDPRIDDLQREPEELTPEQAEAAEGGLLSTNLFDKYQVAPTRLEPTLSPTLTSPTLIDGTDFQKI